MAQVDPSTYARLSFHKDRSDDFYIERATNDIVLVKNGTVVARWKDADVDEALAEGKLYVGGADGVMAPQSLSGDVASLAASGSVTLASPQRLLSQETNITKALIVGNAAGDIGHADGAELVAAVAAKIIEPIAVVINYTHATSAYTGGGDISVGYKDGGAATGVVAANASFGQAASSIIVLRPLSGAALVNKALVMRAASAFTDPGDAAGTAVVKTYYRLIDA